MRIREMPAKRKKQVWKGSLTSFFLEMPTFLKNHEQLIAIHFIQLKNRTGITQGTTVQENTKNNDTSQEKDFFVFFHKTKLAL